MSLQLIVGRSGSGKSHCLYNEIISKSMKYPNSNYLILVPEQFTLQTQKDIVSMHPRQGSMNIDILSFMRLAYRIFEEVGGESSPVLEDTGKSMILRKLISHKRKDLELFNHDVNKQGFIDELKSLISEIYQYSISIEMLENMEKNFSNRPILHGKLHDIVVVYKAFKEFLNAKYITAEEILDVLCEWIPKSKIIAGSIICLDGFTGFTPSQYKLLTLLMKYAKKVIITVTMDKKELDGKDEEYKLFHLSFKMIQKLTLIANTEEIEINPHIFMEDKNKSIVPYRFHKNKALAALEQNLFRYPVHTYLKDQDSITIHAAKDMKQEVKVVIREIKELVRKNNYRYQDIAVITGDIISYGREFRRGFDNAGIPCFIDSKRDILSNPFVEFLRASLEVALHNFSYEAVFRYMRCGLLDIEKEDVDSLENYVIAFGIRGYKRWNQIWTKTYRGQNAGELDRINAVRESFLSGFEPLYGVLKEKNKTVKDYTLALYQFGVKIEAAKKLENAKDLFLEQNLLSMAKEYEQIYGMVMDIYDKLVELLGDEIISLKEYLEVLESGIKEVKVGLIPPGLDQIMVGDIERTRLKDIKALFFVGANEGIIPKNKADGGILTDLEREELKKINIEMAPTKRDAIYTEKFYLYLNMTKPKEKLYITYSKLSEEGKKILPAYIIDSVLKIFPSIAVNDEDIMKEDLSDILSNNDGLDYLILGLKNFPKEINSHMWKELFTYYNSVEKYKDLITQLIKAVYYVGSDHGISKKVAKELYGEQLSGSVTRFEKYSACAFAHFITYGLELKERQEFRLNVPDLGNLFHLAIENFSRRLERSPFNWHTITEDIRTTWGKTAVLEAVSSYGNAIFDSSKRYEYIINRVERITQRTLWALEKQIKKGDFEPSAYELFFSDVNPLDSLNIQLSGEERIKLFGRIDRLDLYEDKDNLMVRIVDYKSGNTAFDLPSLYYGLQIQLALYMSAAMELVGKETRNKILVPAGILYYNIDDPFVEKGNLVEESILKELKMNGIINSDYDVIKHLDNSFLSEGNTLRPSVKSDILPVESNKEGMLTKRSNAADKHKFKYIEDYVKTLVKKTGKEILDGNTTIKPYQLGKKSACDYCLYKSVCGFDNKIDGFDYKRLRGITNEEIWELLKNK